ncbi:hypothetical protein BBP40_010105 [Aspergillus hancockii]|nr:hypothetical protein BBP40_010105 [Aspergillus hancockii]
MLHSSSSAEDGRHQRQLPPAIPPSPTLSNPDMILPYEVERESSTPSPPFNLPSLSHLQSFYNNRPFPSDNNGNGAAPVFHRPQKKPFPRHTWQHDALEASRRLSDIGEEDTSSNSSVVGFGPSLQVTHNRRPAGSPASQRVAEDPEAKEAGERSSSSSSTISGASEPSSLEGSKTRQAGQGASQVGRVVDQDQLIEAVRIMKESANGRVVSTTEEGGPGDELSSVILSGEAERILENAKKRLTLMEGNLTRARSSMRTSPSLSVSPTPSAGGQPLGLGQPVGGLYQSISRADRRASSRPRATYTSSQDSVNNRHSRVYSETRLPSTDQSSLPTVEPDLSRSFSALGSSSASNFQNDERTFRYDPTRAYLTHRASVSKPRSPRASPSNLEENSDTPKGLGISAEDREDKASPIEEYHSAYPLSDPSSRSQSQLQVRDLQDQMKGLHIKISSLKVKAQEDNLRRRSLQSLRTPSPFTAADQYFTNTLELKESHLHSNAVQGPDYPQEIRRSEEYERARGGNEAATNYYGTETSNAKHAQSRSPQVLGPLDEDERSVIESLYEDAEEGEYHSDDSSEIDREALNEILREPLDGDFDDLDSFPTVPNSDARPHEEREDAFDYEHFILHSALGNYSSRLRRTSNVSTSSVETTRPTHDRPFVRHSRTNSGASLSTVASFETATEGDHDDLESVLYWDRKFNDELRTRQHYSDPAAEKQQTNGSVPDMGTPRAIRRQPSRRGPDDEYLSTPRQSMTGSATPTSLVSSLVSTVRAASSPHPKTGNMGINGDDTRLLEQLFKSLGDVCMDLQAITTSPDSDAKRVRLLRRRLDAARRVLDGELDT